MKRPPAPEKSARMTGLRALMFAAKTLPASPYNWNIVWLRRRKLPAATSAAGRAGVPVSALMSAGRSAAIDDAVPTLKVTHSVIIDAAWVMRFIHRLHVIARRAIAHRVHECATCAQYPFHRCEIAG